MRVPGNISVQTENGKVVKIILGSNETEGPEEILREIEEYLSGQRKSFSFQVEIRGTPFQKRVWEEVRKIPYGETKTYSEIAKNSERPPEQWDRLFRKTLFLSIYRATGWFLRKDSVVSAQAWNGRNT